MSDPTTTVAGSLVAALHASIVAAVDDANVQVTVGFPWPQDAADMIAIGDVVSDQVAATMTPQRTRDETLTVDVLLSVFRPGGQEQAIVALQRAYALLGAVAHRLRMDDPTVGGTVWQCILTAHRMSSAPFATDTAEGRTTEILATFTAKARIKG